MPLLLKSLFIISIFFSCLIPWVSVADNSAELQSQYIQTPLVVEILNNSERREPDIPSNHQWPKGKHRVMTPYLVKLYSIPVEGSCIPETHMICSHKYYLAVSDYGEAPLQGVFYLGTVGEITQFKWVNTARTDGIIDVKALNYPEYAFKMNPKLSKISKHYRIEIKMEGVIKLNIMKISR
ncbi:MAG TPA: hypothetical protein VMT12_01730 [Syntrophales bacterium]|nr:hypothetical protein [Syntrophales bacterium]